MNWEIIFIVLIIIFFNILILNIFRLQKELKLLNKKPKPYNNLRSTNKYKSLDSGCDGLNIRKDGQSVKMKMNKIASHVPIDINKINKTNAHFVPKSIQAEQTI